ncbi:hypothetical protein ACVXZ4_05115 [Lacisediminihabitans sp. FW035]
MFTFWTRATLLQRLSFVILLLAVLVGIGSFIWSYSSWWMSLLVLAGLVLNAIGRNFHGPGRNPQENDPNRR